MSNFSTPQKVVDTIRASDAVERIRADNRVRINNVANGAPPLTAEEAKQWGLNINVNWGEMAVLGAHAKRQITNAFTSSARFFKVSIPMAPAEKRLSWEMWITEFINRKMKRSRDYYFMCQNRFAGLVLHGIGPQLWYNIGKDSDSWLGKFKAIEDLRLPTDTPISFENLCHFAVRERYTIYSLSESAFGKYSDPRWNKEVVKDILSKYWELNYETTQYTWLTAPEKMAELVKQNGGFYSSDATPTIPVWLFYYYDDEGKEKGWKLKVVPDTDSGIRGAPADKFIYDSGNRIIARELSQILHVQFADLNLNPPQMYYSIRSLGYELMEPCFWTNIARCKALQHLCESFNIWLRVSDPAGKARAQKVEMFNKAILPEGVTIVPQNERHQVDASLIEMVMAQLKQLMSEVSASYTQQADTGTQKEQTAYETSVKLSMVNAMMSAILNTAFFQETFAYREIGRRFCLRNSHDEDAREFQKEAARRGIPKVFLNVELWDIEPEIPLGAGNPSMAMSRAQQLIQMRPMFGPQGQQEILHEATAVITDDFRKADRWVPIDQNQQMTDGQSWTLSIFGTLMEGVPVPNKEGLSPIDQIETALALMAGVISRIEKTTNVATMPEFIGLQTVGQHITGLIDQLAQNPEEKQRVKQFSDSLGKLMNIVKALGQRMMEQQQQQGGADQNGQAQQDAAKAHSLVLQTSMKAKTSELKSEQQRRHKEQSFEADQHRKNIETIAEIGREDAKNKAEIDRQKTSEPVDGGSTT